MNRYRKCVLYLVLATLSFATSVSLANTPKDESSPTAELVFISERLEQVSAALDESSTKLVPLFDQLDSAGRRVDHLWLFLGKSMSDFPEGRKVTEQARTILEKLRKRRAALLYDHNDDLGYIAEDEFDLSEVTLLGLAGRSDEALARILTVSPGGGCGNWIASVEYTNFLRGVAILEREGKFQKAKEMLKKAVMREELVLGGRVDRGELGAHFGYLNLRTGDTEAAVVDYQRVVDLFPGTEGESHARKMLLELKRLRLPTAQGILSTYPDELEIAVSSLRIHQFRDAESVLLHHFSAAPLAEKGHYARGLAFTPSSTVVEVLKRELWRKEAKIHESEKAILDSVILRALHQQNSDGEIIRYLRSLALYEQLERHALWEINRSMMDIFSRKIQRSSEEWDRVFATPKALSEDWLLWLESNDHVHLRNV